MQFFIDCNGLDISLRHVTAILHSDMYECDLVRGEGDLVECVLCINSTQLPLQFLLEDEHILLENNFEEFIDLHQFLAGEISSKLLRKAVQAQVLEVLENYVYEESHYYEILEESINQSSGYHISQQGLDYVLEYFDSTSKTWQELHRGSCLQYLESLVKSEKH